MARRKFSEKEVLEILAWQGIMLCCFRCKGPFFVHNGDTDTMVILRKPEREHLHEIGLDGPDTPKNCRYGCDECHDVVTNGSKATTAGSSKHRIAKAKRIAAGGKKAKSPMKKPPKGYKHKWAKRKFPNAKV